MKRYVWIGVCSLLLHLALFWPSPDRSRDDGKGLALSVRFVEFAQERPAVSDKPVVAPTHIASPAPTQQSPARAVTGAPDVSGRAESRSKLAASEPRPVGTPHQAGLVPPAHALDPDGRLGDSEGGGSRHPSWARYRIALASAAALRVRVALSHQALEDVERSLTVEIGGLEGSPARVRVVATSGRSDLDTLVLRAFERAVGDVPRPREEWGTEWVVRLPVILARTSDDS